MTSTVTSEISQNSAPEFPLEPAQAAQKNQLIIIKRDGDLATYQEHKITTAICNAILANEPSAPSHVKQTASVIAEKITKRFKSIYPSGGKVNIEDVQDQVELGLMRESMHKVARSYVLYREHRAQQRKKHSLAQADGQAQSIDQSLAAMFKRMTNACFGLADVNADIVLEAAKKNLYKGITSQEIDTALIMAVRPLIEDEPNYSFVAARILLASLKQEVGDALTLPKIDDQNFYQDAFTASLKQGCEWGLLDSVLIDKSTVDFELSVLAQALKPERDLKFNYLGIQTLYDRYFLHWKKQRIELPQVFFMRVAMGLSVKEPKPTERAIEYYNLLSSFDFMSSTPTLFNSGTRRPQLSSCYLTTVPDDLGGIYDALKDNALLSKWAGGLGNDWTNVRSLGSRINGTNGESQGIVPFLKVTNDTAVAVNQGGKRKGAVCAYLETWHLDLEDFLDLRKNTGDERRRTHDMNSANWIPDLFMKRVFEQGTWTLFSPSDVPDLHDLTGQAFEARYVEYEEKVRSGEITLSKQIPAQELWRKMLSMLFETGHPWITFKDPCNVRSPQQHVGVVHSSNLCTEITLNTNPDEIAVCNLGSINLLNHIHDGELDAQHLQRTVKTAVRMLDNVIDINYYACPQAENSNLKHRPIGLGLVGFQDALYQLKLSYASEEAVYFADSSMELISYFAIQASTDLAAERGAYPSYDGSLWSQGVLPIDSQRLLEEQRGKQYSIFNYEQTLDGRPINIDLANSEILDWSDLRKKVIEQGMRNSNVMAIAPTATISNIVGVSQSIEPNYQNLYVKSNLSGEFTVVNSNLVKALKAEGIWDAAMVNDLKIYNGSLQAIDRVPADIKVLFAQAFEIDSHWLIEAAARRQKWIDQAQSLNLYIEKPSGKHLDSLYKTAWSRGLKTTYYLRSLGATQMETNAASELSQRGVEDEHGEPDEFDLPQANEGPKICSILEPDCEACQ